MSGNPLGLQDIGAGMEGVEGVSRHREGGGESLRFTRTANSAPLAVSAPIHDLGTVSGLHFAFVLRSKHLKPGRQDWEDGRFLIDWHAPGGGKVLETDYVSSIRHTCFHREKGVILTPPKSPAVPVPRFEHQGASGYFELTELAITPVKPRTWWPFAVIGLIAAWTTWVYFLLGSSGKTTRRRRVACALLWVFVASQLILPGPWKSVRPLVGDLNLGSSVAVAETTVSPMPPTNSGKAPPPVATAIAPSDDRTVKSNPLLRLKLLLSQARPLLHALMMAAPALGFMVLVGIRPGILLAALLAAGIELSQLAFGYGFGWDDVLDLVSDGMGILAAAFSCRCLLRRVPWSRHTAAGQ